MAVDIWTYRNEGLLGVDVTRGVDVTGFSVEAIDGSIGKIDDATYDIAACTSEHVLLPDHYADRLDAHYTSALVPDGSGARWTLRGVLDVHAPLVGGKVARVIVDGLREAATAQGVLLDEWLARG